MRVWGVTRNRDHQILSQSILDFPPRSADTDWDAVICALCRELDLARPVILKKHIGDLLRFSRAVFKAGDFLEDIAFDRFEVEVFPEPKKK